MPELPEVETYVRYFRSLLKGRRIVRFVSHWPKQIEPDFATVERAVTGKWVARLHRRAKYIVADLAETRRGALSARSAASGAPTGAGHLLIHLRMSGRLEWSGLRPAASSHLRAALHLDDGHTLWFCDARKFGRIGFTRDYRATLCHLGAEPLDRGFTADRLSRLLRGRERRLKPLLLDQTLVAGLGNIYVDETLFQAGLHPLTRACDLKKAEVRALHRAIRAVLRKAVALGGTSFDWVYPGGEMKEHLRVYGRAGRPCTNCGTPIAALRVGQRGTHVCPRCQPL